jgi:hypothetical protein
VEELSDNHMGAREKWYRSFLFGKAGSKLGPLESHTPFESNLSFFNLCFTCNLLSGNPIFQHLRKPLITSQTLSHFNNKQNGQHQMHRLPTSETTLRLLWQADRKAQQAQVQQQ